jgi:hypothetical protein
MKLIQKWQNSNPNLGANTKAGTFKAQLLSQLNLSEF